MGAAPAIASEPTADAQLEADIAVAKGAFLGAATPAARAKAWDRLKALTAQRSAAQVERMERDRGLR